MKKPDHEHIVSIGGHNFIVAINDTNTQQVYMTCFGFNNVNKLNDEDQTDVLDWYASVVDPYKKGDNMLISKSDSGMTIISIGSLYKNLNAIIPSPADHDFDHVNRVMWELVDLWEQKKILEGL
jgi:hypothetical protein